MMTELAVDELPAADKIPSWIEEAVGSRFKELQNNYRQQNYFKMKLAKLKRLSKSGKYPKTIRQLSVPPLKLPSTTPCYYRVEKAFQAALETYKTACLEALIDGLEDEVQEVEKLIGFEQWSTAVYNEVSDSLATNYVMPQEYIGRTMDDLRLYMSKIRVCWNVFVERISAETKRVEEEALRSAARDEIDEMAFSKQSREKARKRRFTDSQMPPPKNVSLSSYRSNLVAKPQIPMQSPGHMMPPQSPRNGISQFQSPNAVPHSPRIQSNYVHPSQSLHQHQQFTHNNHFAPPQSPRHIPPQSPRHIPPQSPRHIPPQSPMHIPPQSPAHIPPQSPMHNPSQTHTNLPPQSPRYAPPQSPMHIPPQSPRPPPPIHFGYPPHS